MSSCALVCGCDKWKQKNLDFLDVISLLRLLLQEYKCPWGVQGEYLRNKGFCPVCYCELSHCDCSDDEQDLGG